MPKGAYLNYDHNELPRENKATFIEGSEVRGKLAATTICTLANFRPANGQGSSSNYWAKVRLKLN